MEHQHKYTNDLINESSPYLLQHAHNPVDWKPWNEDVLEQAKREKKMLLISIGYAACHWCHVMEHESFEDSTVAALMNEHFICIKVDREERPDVDDVYMTACQLVSQRGCGWPLNAFALPDGRPVWAGTYFPKEQWVNILDQFKTLYKNDLPKLEDAATRITKGVQSFDNDMVINPEKDEFSMENLQSIGLRFISNVDMDKGGRRGSPKFPMPSNWEFMLKYYHYNQYSKAKLAATTTLTQMAAGGIYDQVGGGFSRYSVDSLWLVPHFEKMLYDNGQLLSVYSQAYTLTKDELYLRVIDQTIAFCNRELLDPAGGYYASLDADSEGEEGKYYVWSKAEIDSILNDKQKSEIFCKYYDITQEGNFEGHNIPNLSRFAVEDQVSTIPDEDQLILTECISLLFQARQSRVRPGTDDKVLASWNGLMAKGLADAYMATGNEDYLTKAIQNMDFLLQNMVQKDGSLKRNFKNGKVTINGFLDDYATVIDALLRIYEATFDHSYLVQAEQLTKYVNDHFGDGDSFYFYTSDLDPKLIARRKEISDNVIPSSNSIIARNLYKLGTIISNDSMIAKSRHMMLLMQDAIIKSGQPNFYANWCSLLLDFITTPYEVVIIGPEANNFAREMQSHFIPNAWYLGSLQEENLPLMKGKYQEGQTTIYVCQNKVCKLPVTSVSQALGLLKDNRQ